MVGVVFPGKAFMIEKNGLQSKEQIEVQRRSRPSGRAKIKDGKKGEVSSSELRVTSKKKISSSVIGFAAWLSQESRVTSKTSALSPPNSILRTKYWWLWYPYRWWVALCQWQTGAGGGRPAALIASRYLAQPAAGRFAVIGALHVSRH